MRMVPTILIAGLLLGASATRGSASGAFQKIDPQVVQRLQAMRARFGEPARLPGLAESDLSSGRRAPALGSINWVGNGFAVAPDFGLGQLLPTATADGAGGGIVAWTDFRSGKTDVYAQRVTSNGDISPGWPATGVRLCVADSFDYSGSVTSDAAGGAFVVFARYSIVGGVKLMAQHVTAAGALSPGWPADGISLTPENATGGGGAVPTNDGFLLMRWYNAQAELRVRRLTSAGADAPGWSSSGLLIGHAPVYAAGGAPDGAGGAYVCWVQNDSLLLTRVAAGGGFASGWDANGLLVQDQTVYSEQASVSLLSNGDAMVFWEDFRNTDVDIYAMRCTSGGALAGGWPAGGVAAVSGSGDERRPQSVPDGAGGALVTWDDPSGNLLMQRVTSGGAISPGWPAGGSTLCTGATTKDLMWPPISDGASGAIVAWSEDTGGGADVSAQRVAAAGTISIGWPAEGAVMSNAAQDQNNAVPIPDGASGAIVFWTDTRAIFPQIYAGRVISDGTVPALASLVSATANPGGVSLRWFTPDAASFAADLECATGAADFVTLARLQASGDGTIAYEDHDVTAGESYRYRLVATGSGGRQVLGEVSIRVPTGARLAVSGFRPNPAAGSPRVACTLESAEPARLTVLDVAGRRVASRELAGIPGEHVVPLDAERLSPGLYLLQLEQGTRRAFGRAVLTR